MRISTALLVLMLATAVNIGPASALTISVNSKVGPWNPVLNAGFAYSTDASTWAPVFIDASSGISFATGSQITVQWLSGLVGCCGTASVDANGHVGFGGNKNANRAYPSQHTPADWDTWVMALIGTFANSSGVIVGAPFEVGLLRSLTVPVGATRLQLGVNDDVWGDNQGAFNLLVTGVPVPEPGTSVLMGLGLVALTVLRRRQYQQ